MRGNRRGSSVSFLALYFVTISVILLLVYYNNNVKSFSSGTTVNGVDISDLSMKDAKQKYIDSVKNMGINFKFGTETCNVKVNDIVTYVIGESNDSDNSLDEFKYKDFNGKANSIKIKYKVKNKEFQSFTNRVLQKEKTEPTDAYIGYNKKNKKYEIIPEVVGNNFKYEELVSITENSLNNNTDLSKDLDIDISELGQEPKVTSSDKRLNSLLTKANNFITKKLIISVDGKNKGAVIDCSKYKKYCKVSDDKVSIDYSFLDDIIYELARKYNTIGTTRKFKTHTGKTIKIGGGIYGWQLNTEETKKAIKNVINSNKLNTCDVVWTQEAKGWGKDEIGKTYIEISLSEQHLYYFKNGKLKLDSPIVSGLDSSAERRTNKGVGMIYGRRDHGYLRGSSWNTYVNWFMPFNYNGQGMHDATWRSSFGGNIYKYNGSHGCVNMPLDKAGKLYKMTDNGVPVIVY